MRWANSLGAARPVTVCSTWQVSRPPCPGGNSWADGSPRSSCSLGNGTLVLGAHLACQELFSQGLVSKMPSIVAVQAAGCAPLARSFENGQANPANIEGEPTIAEGIAIARPARGAQILTAVRDTGGTIVTVTDDQVRAAHASLGTGRPLR